jgi:hypothetical protein
VQHNSGRTELRIVVPEGPWEDLVRDACPAEATLNVATVALDDLHQVLIHAVAEGRAPDLALLDSVWVPEFAASGFLLPLDELDAEWLDTEYLADVLDPLACGIAVMSSPQLASTLHKPGRISSMPGRSCYAWG